MNLLISAVSNARPANEFDPVREIIFNQFRQNRSDRQHAAYNREQIYVFVRNTTLAGKYLYPRAALTLF